MLHIRCIPPLVAVRLTRCLAPALAQLLAVAALGCRDAPTAPESATPSPTPALAASATAGPLAFSQVSGGTFHTCGVTADGRAYCWGINIHGQLGDGSTAQRLVPVAVLGGFRFRHVSAGYQHTCGVTTENRVYCWGDNLRGQLGDGTKGEGNRRLAPVAVAGGRRFHQVRAGSFFTCAITPSDAAFCWGENAQGQLGDGTIVPEGRATPVRVLGGLQWRQLSGGGEHTCGVTQTDRVYCWGLNRYGHLGDGTTTRRLKPVAVSGGRRFRQVDAGGTHTCAVTTGNAAYCWGLGGLGQLGDGTNTNRLTPSAVAGQHSFEHVNAGNFHTCGVTTAGPGYCWGYNRGGGQVGGQLGDGTSTDRSSPTPLGIALELRQVSAGLAHTCGVTTNNRAYCWGFNAGRLGDGTTELRLLPVPVAAPM